MSANQKSLLLIMLFAVTATAVIQCGMVRLREKLSAAEMKEIVKFLKLFPVFEKPEPTRFGHLVFEKPAKTIIPDQYGYILYFLDEDNRLTTIETACN